MTTAPPCGEHAVVLGAATVGAGFESVIDLLAPYVEADPTYAGQLCVHHQGQRVVDVCWGPAFTPETLLPVFSSSKGAIGVVIACLVREGLIDLDAEVATYWPEFAAKGKGRVTVRQLLSHQAGLVGVTGGYSSAEMYDNVGLAARLADQRPYWMPGQAHGYHALTIGVLANELVRRVTGSGLANYLSSRVTGPRHIDLYLGLPADLDWRVADVRLPTADEMAALPDAIPAPNRDAMSSVIGARDGSPVFIACNTEEFRRAEVPAAGVLTSARGLSAMYAALHHEIEGRPPLLDADTVAAVSQQQVSGPDMIGTMPSTFAIVFQKPTAHHPFGSFRAFGHDGLGGSLAFSDPTYDLAFGYVVQRIPLPGGADRRAIELSQAVRRCLR